MQVKDEEWGGEFVDVDSTQDRSILQVHAIEYVEESELQEVLVACDQYDHWYHILCEGLRSIPEDELHICVSCQD